MMLFKVGVRYLDAVYHVLAETEERATEIITQDLENAGFEEETDYVFDYVETWYLDKEGVIKIE